MLGRFVREHGVSEEDAGNLEFVTSELLSNAVDHGGGGAAMEESDLTSDVRMQLHARVTDGQWEIRVADQGGGDPAELEPRHDPIEQLAGERRAREGETGREEGEGGQREGERGHREH